MKRKTCECALSAVVLFAGMLAIAADQPADPGVTPPQTPASQTAQPQVAAPAGTSAESAFDETKAPDWKGPVQGTSPGDPESDPLMRKILDVGREIDKTAGKTGSPAGAEPDVTTQPAGETSLTRNSIRSFGILCLVIALIFFMGYLVRRFGKRTPLFAGPVLAQVMGRVYLAPRMSLYFVRTGGKVLVVGVTPNSMSLITEFEADLFEALARSGAEGEAEPGGNTAEFQKQLEKNVAAAFKPAADLGEDADIVALRGDIQRLQKYLQETTRGQKG